MAARAKAAMVKTYPRLTPERHGEDYYYSLCALHLHWRHEASLLGSHESYAAVVEANKDAIAAATANEQVGAAIEAAIRFLQAQGHTLADYGGGDDGAVADNAELPAAELHACVLDPGAAAQSSPPELHLQVAPSQQAANAAAASNEGPGMSDSIYQQRLGMMSPAQKLAHDTVKQHSLACHADTSHAPLHLFITGGAGTGKSFEIEMLQETLIRLHPSARHCPVALAAPTGVAAYNIHGCTIHRTFGLPVEDVRRGRTGGVLEQRVQYTPLQGVKLEEARARLQGLQYVIIDEISMVSFRTLHFVDRCATHRIALLPPWALRSPTTAWTPTVLPARPQLISDPRAPCSDVMPHLLSACSVAQGPLKFWSA